MYWVEVFGASFLLSAVWVLWRGGAPERLVAIGFLIAWLASMLVEPWSEIRFARVLITTAAIDTALLVLLAWLAMRTDRRWIQVATGFQVLIVLAHIVKAVQPEGIRMGYMILTNLWPVLQILLLIFGTIAYRRRLAVQNNGQS